VSDFTVKYIGNLSTQIEHLDTGKIITTDAPKDNKGLGRTFSPTDLASSSLASCMLTIIAIACQTHNINIKTMNSNISKTMSSQLPRRISKIKIGINIVGILNEKSKKIIARSAKNCPVHHSLNPNIDIDLKINYSSL
jgi:uncharacterized OsmC-like protein